MVTTVQSNSAHEAVLRYCLATMSRLAACSRMDLEEALEVDARYLYSPLWSDEPDPWQESCVRDWVSDQRKMKTRLKDIDKTLHGELEKAKENREKVVVKHPDLVRENGSPRETARKVLLALPQQTLEGVPDLSYGTVRDISQPLQDEGLMRQDERGYWHRTPKADRWLA